MRVLQFDTFLEEINNNLAIETQPKYGFALKPSLTKVTYCIYYSTSTGMKLWKYSIEPLTYKFSIIESEANKSHKKL